MKGVTNMKSQRSASAKRRSYISLLLTFVLWGSLYVVSKFVLGKLPPFTISFFRFLLAFLSLSFVDRHPSRRLGREHFPYVLLIGFGGYFITVGAQLLGTKYAGASTASLINSMNPVTMTLFGFLLLHEPLTIRKVTGILLSILGVFVILGGGLQGAGTVGILLSLFAVFAWSFISVMTRKITKLYDPLHISRLACGVAAICYLPAAILESSEAEELKPDGNAVVNMMQFLSGMVAMVISSGIISNAQIHGTTPAAGTLTGTMTSIFILIGVAAVLNLLENLILFFRKRAADPG